MYQPEAGDSSSSSSSESSTDTEMVQVDVCTVLTRNSEGLRQCESSNLTDAVSPEMVLDSGNTNCRSRCRRLVEPSKPQLLMGSPLCIRASANNGDADPVWWDMEQALAYLHVAFISELQKSARERRTVFSSHTSRPQTVGTCHQKLTS